MNCAVALATGGFDCVSHGRESITNPGYVARKVTLPEIMDRDRQCPNVFFPSRPTTSNYVQAWTSNHFARYFVNSLLVAAVTTIGAVLLSAMMAFASRDVCAQWTCAPFFDRFASKRSR